MSFSTRLLAWQGRFIIRYAWLIVISALLLTGLSLYYVKDNLGVNNNSAEMLSPDLPFQKNTKRLEQAFPQDAGTMIFVVDALTPEETALSASILSERLQTNNQYFSSSYIPEDNAFFRQQALLYLSIDELESLSTNLIEAQPFIGYLAQHYSLKGLLHILSEALASEESVIGNSLPNLLNAISQSLQSTAQGNYQPISWQTILSPNKLTNKTRRIVIAKPIKNFHAIMPAAAAIEKAREISQQIQTEFSGVSIHITGETALEHEELESIGDGAVLSGIGSFLLVCILLYICLRSVKLLLATLLILLMGLSLTAGFAAVTIGHLNVISISFAALYIGLGVDFAIHVNLHYRDEIASKHNNDIAIQKTLQRLGFSLFLCAITTSIGFFTFVPTDYKGVSELGLISGASMFIALFLSLFVLPAFLKLFHLKNAKILQDSEHACMISFPFRYKKSIRISSILIGLACLFIIPYITFDSNPVNMRNPKSPSVETFKRLLQSKTESPYVLYTLSDSLSSAQQLSEQLKQVATVHSTVNLESLLATEQEEKLYIIEDLNMMLGGQLQNFNAIPQASDTLVVLQDFSQLLSQQINQGANVDITLLQNLKMQVDAFIVSLQQQTDNTLALTLDKSILGLLPYTMNTLNQSLTAYEFSLTDLPDIIRLQWLSPTGIYRTMVTPKQDLNIPANLKQFAKDVHTVEPTATGLPIADLASGEAVVNAFQQAFSAAFIIISLFLIFILRSFKKAFLVMGPLSLAALLTCTVNVFLGIPFNFANIIALPLLLGMGVDSGIHIMHCLHSEQHHSSDKEEQQQNSTARGVMFSSITTMSSFVSLALIPHFGISSMGITLAVGISFMLLCTLVVLPAFTHKTL